MNDNTRTLAEVIEKYIEALKLKGKLQEASVITGWEDLVGRRVASQTENLRIKDKKLYVKVNSAIVRSELLMIRSELVLRINKQAGEEILQEIVLY